MQDLALRLLKYILLFFWTFYCISWIVKTYKHIGELWNIVAIVPVHAPRQTLFPNISLSQLYLNVLILPPDNRMQNYCVLHSLNPCWFIDFVTFGGILCLWWFIVSHDKTWNFVKMNDTLETLNLFFVLGISIFCSACCFCHILQNVNDRYR